MRKEQKNRMLSEAHHYARKQGPFEYGRSRVDFIEGYKRAFDLYSSTKEIEQLVCDCGNNLSDKEVYFGQCLQCDKRIE